MESSHKPILVIKIGTHALLGEHEMPKMMFDRVANTIRGLTDQYRILLVTSGAIGFGVRALDLKSRPTDINQLQALAMVGQAGLLRRWREAFDETMIGQVLVTRHDLANDEVTYTLMRSIEAVWSYGAVPIVNENDAVSHEEISFSDNDQLAAEIVAAIGASYLILLTDQDGIQADFGRSTQRRIEVANLNDVERYIMPTKSSLGSGGLSSKVTAAAVALNAEADVYIGLLDETHDITDILSGKSGTRIVQ